MHILKIPDPPPPSRSGPVQPSCYGMVYIQEYIRIRIA